MMSGFDSVSADWMKSKLPDYNFMPVDTASASTDDVAMPLEPGSSVAAAFVNGDMKMGAIGTVTYVDNDHIVAFGHPFLKKGSINYFMHNAYIFTVVNNLSSSFKLGSIGLKSARLPRTGAPVSAASTTTWHRAFRLRLTCAIPIPIRL